MSDSYTKAVEELRLLMGNTKGREDHFKNRHTPRDSYEPQINLNDEVMISVAKVNT